MRAFFLLVVVFTCAVALVQTELDSPTTPPIPCKNFRECLEMVRNATLKKEDEETAENGIVWRHFFWLIALLVAFCTVLFALFCAAKYRTKIRKQKRSASTTTLASGILKWLGFRRTTTTERFLDIATESETFVHGRVSLTIVPDGGVFVRSMMASTDATAIAPPDATVAEVHEADDLSLVLDGIATS